MVILVKIVKIGQLQMGVESWEPIMHSGYFRLKHSETNAGDHPLKKIPSDHDHLSTRYAGAGRVQTIKFFLSQNRKENLVIHFFRN
jgi:hypothetical protein